MWRVDKDPHLSSTFGTVSVLDRPPDFDALRARMERATWAVPRLRWRVQPAPVNLSAPTWVDDPDFDIDNHVRRIALPKPGSMRQLLDLATLLVNDSFDRMRPLWQFIVIEGLRGGKAALVQKMHHTITDGEGGVQMSLQFLDFERDAPPPPPIDRAGAPTSRRRHRARRPPSRCATCSPAASGCRSAWPARCTSCSPTRRRSRPPARRRSTPSAASCPSCRTSSGPTRRCGPSARCAATSRSCGRRSGPPRTPPSASAARSTRRSSPPPPRPPSRYHDDLGAPVDDAAHHDGGQHPHVEQPRPTPSRSPG